MAQGPTGSKTRLVLLGTKGGPSLGKSYRNNPATLILINDIPYLIDCGYGVSRQLIALSARPVVVAAEDTSGAGD